MTAPFVHLRLHSEYSLIDSLLRVKGVVNAAAHEHMPAVAITDHLNLFAAIKFYKAALAKGIKPILGADVAVFNEKTPTQPFIITCLCQNHQGYQNLIQLLSKAYTEGQVQFQQSPQIAREWLATHQAGLLILSGERQGDVGQALLKQDEQEAQQLLDFWQKHFPDRYYMEVQRNDRLGQIPYLEAAFHLACRRGVPLVATNDVRFLKEESFEAHEARICIQQGVTLDSPQRSREYSPQQYFKTSEQMLQLFADLPEACANTVEIAKRCTVPLTLSKVFLPKFPTPKHKSAEDYCIELAEAGLKERLMHMPDKSFSNEIYQQRLVHELNVINGMGYAGYFLIVADFIAWAKAQGIPVGPGRGSGAGSLVAYALKITDLDPLQYELLFERFLNPERISLPDFDIDFCMLGRDRVIDYVTQKYGRQCVSQIITFGTMAAKAVVRDVGRVLGHPYGFVDKIAKLVPFELGITLDKALEQEEILKSRYEQEDDVKELIDLARTLEGLTRNAGKHAGGVVIAPSALTDFSPLYAEAGEPNHVVTQFDKDDVETVGLIKFDFLGLRNLTIIDWAVKIINEKNQHENLPLLNITTIPLDDISTYELIKRGETSAVFQVESRGMKELIRRLKPDNFEEIIALVALYRPGPLQSGMVEDFIDRKHGRATVIYPHEAIAPILKPTYGVILYQEQVMQIAQVLAGYTLGGADLLRRAMGKKKPEEMAKQREIFLKGATQNHVERHTANVIFDLMEKFAGYGFNKSHSAAYALITYQTAWLKAHYPAEYMAAVLSSDMDNTDKVVSMILECRRMKITLLPPDIQESDYYFTVPKSQHVPDGFRVLARRGDDEQARCTDSTLSLRDEPQQRQNEKGEGCIRFGLGAIKGVGEAAIEAVMERRQAIGRFQDLFEFCRIVANRKVTKRTLEALIRAGCMDGFGQTRATLLASLPLALSEAEQYHKRRNQRQQDLFSILESEEAPPPYVLVANHNEAERLQGEKETLGFYLSGHPLDRYQREFALLKILNIDEIDIAQSAIVRTAGIMSSHRGFLTKRGTKMGVITIEDKTAKVDVTLFSDLYREAQEKLIKDEIFLIEGEASIDEFTQQIRIVARKLFTLEEMFSSYAQTLVLQFTQDKMTAHESERLAALLSPHRGGHTQIKFHYLTEEGAIELQPEESWQIKLSRHLLEQLEQYLGKDNIFIGF